MPSSCWIGVSNQHQQWLGTTTSSRGCGLTKPQYTHFHHARKSSCSKAPGLCLKSSNSHSNKGVRSSLCGPTLAAVWSQQIESFFPCGGRPGDVDVMTVREIGKEPLQPGQYVHGREST